MLFVNLPDKNEAVTDPTTIDREHIARPPEGQCPVQVSPVTPVMHLYVFVRADRAVTEIAAHYEALVNELTERIYARGVTVSHVLVSAYDPSSAEARTLVFHSCNVKPAVSITRALQYFAAAGASSGGCELQSVASRLELAATTKSAVPPALLDGNEPHSSAPFFDAVPTYALVLLLDHGARAAALEECPIAGGAVPFFNGLSIPYANGTLDAERVFYLGVATSETDEKPEVMAARCAGLEGMPRPLLDVLVPSANKSFLPLTQALGERGRFIDVCDAVATNGVESVANAVRAIHKKLGLPEEPIPAEASPQPSPQPSPPQETPSRQPPASLPRGVPP